VVVVLLVVLDVLDVLVVSAESMCGFGPPEMAHADPPERKAATDAPTINRTARSLPTMICPFLVRTARGSCAI
jgi:hypothetical protein